MNRRSFLAGMAGGAAAASLAGCATGDAASCLYGPDGAPVCPDSGHCECPRDEGGSCEAAPDGRAGRGDACVGDAGTGWALEQIVTVPNPGDANFANHGHRVVIPLPDAGAVYPQRPDSKVWAFVGGIDFTEHRRARTLYRFNLHDLSETRHLTFPDDGYHNGVSDVLFVKETARLYVLCTAPNTLVEVDPVTGEWRDLAYLPTSSNGKMAYHGSGSLFVITQTSPTRLFKYGIEEGEVLCSADCPAGFDGGHAVACWGDWVFGTTGAFRQDIKLMAFDARSCAMAYATDLSGYQVGTHEVALVDHDDGQATLWIGPEGGTQSAGESQAPLRVNLASWEDWTPVHPEGVPFEQPIWGCRLDARGTVWVTYGTEGGGVYIGFDAVTGAVRQRIQLPPELPFANGGLAVHGSVAFGTCFPSFATPGADGFAFRLRLEAA